MNATTPTKHPRVQRPLFFVLFFIAPLLGMGGSVPAPDQTLRNQYPGTPVRGLTKTQLSAFEKGQDLFSRLWRRADGLGPGFNANACMTCHHNPLPGGNEFAPSTFVAHSPSCTDVLGGNSCQRFTLGPNEEPQQRALPADAVFRKPQSLFGIGMLEAVSDVDLQALAERQKNDPDGVRGIPGRTAEGRIGRFGWKSRFATIDDFVVAAFNAELGMTSSKYPSDGGTQRGPVEVNGAVVSSVSQFLRLLAAPPDTARGDVNAGKRLFDDMRCSACHVPALRTGRSSVKLLSGRTIYPYSDLLLHDMGPALAEAIDEAGAGNARFRTPPLWGLNASGPPYLHDGRAKSVEEAILLHGGEAAKAVERFRLLSDPARASVLKFLSSL